MSLLRAFLDAAAWRAEPNGPPASRGLSLFLVQGGGCDGCASEIDALRAGAYDIERHDIRFVDTPRDAELLLVTGSVTRGMVPWVEAAWRAMPAPKGLAVIGDCAAGAGPFPPGYAVAGGVEHGVFAGMVRCDLTLRGCPPAPEEILRALNRLATGEIVSQ